MGSMLNFNVGVLGHVDSGKTSLAKVLSMTASTASFDKNPQSKERGITLDLGFSSFVVDSPLKLQDGDPEKLQYTLVDCPGHASLIRTIIGGAQIIDLMMLVVDVTKGLQTQTAECLVIGQILCNKMLVVLNKVDLIPEGKRDATIEKMKKRMIKTLEATRFAGCPIIAVAAKPGGPDATDTASTGIDTLIDSLKSLTFRPDRNPDGAFIFSVDHCFSIRGQGTVMTGTVLSGSVNNNDTVEIPSMKVTKKVKSMQMFHQPVQTAMQGDRLGICVTQFDPKNLERGLVCTPGALPTIVAGIIKVNKIDYFKGKVATKSKFHISIGHETVMGNVTFFGLCDGAYNESDVFNFDLEYKYQDELLSKSKLTGDDVTQPKVQYAFLELETPVTCQEKSLVIGSKLDTDIHSNVCRIAFHGSLVEAVIDSQYAATFLPKLKVFKDKCKEGVVERKVDDYSVICRGLFKKESNIDMFLGLKIKLSTGEDGIIDGSFGQSGKFKVRIPDGLSESTAQILAGKVKKTKVKPGQESTNQKEASSEVQNITLTLNFKRFIYDPKKKKVPTATLR